jgi:nucleotide-binding universal stress UspA family protein
MKTSIRSIVVGVADLQNDPILAAATRLAEGLGAELHALHGYEIPHSVLRTHQVLGTPVPALRSRYERELAARLAAEVHRLSPDAKVRSSAVDCAAGEAIMSAATTAGADLIVVGATRQGPMMRHILGSTADRVIRTSAIPVLVVRPPFVTEFRRVVLTTDLSDLSAAALRRGIDIVAQLGKPHTPEVRCVMATWVSEWIRPAIPPEKLREEALGELSRFLDRTALPFDDIEPCVRIGDPAKEVVAAAAEWSADLIVVGTRGRSSVSRFLLGSVAGSVLRSAFCNVLVVPAGVGRSSEAGPESPAVEAPTTRGGANTAP